ncbi:GNAT family N-acetyltransferase [Paenibacillus ginsengarvi]|uniref:GNAT family N-acetyltransferase n=1 Tax=Paenibacillus ginsengarvi TaxID=400777 RepID=A0A3B0BE07_9BACL|nr:GNAT family N-acetyltransferase [Paenibacillus ginsengarvi]RKN70669.1 GNAT family N-acetyltransferase [Paenibacillus ginsengarvi]
MSGIVIQKIDYLYKSKLLPLLAESTEEGFRHIARLADDYESGANRFDKLGEALFLAYLHDEIVGVCGLNCDPYSNGSGVGRVRRLYVSPSARRYGIGRKLIDAVISHARDHYDILVLRADHPVAYAFYHSIGFMKHDDLESHTHSLRLAAKDPSNSM